MTIDTMELMHLLCVMERGMIDKQNEPSCSSRQQPLEKGDIDFGIDSVRLEPGPMTSTCSSSPWFMNWDLFRGHLGPDEYLRVVERRPIGHAQEELKAETSLAPDMGSQRSRTREIQIDR